MSSSLIEIERSLLGTLLIDAEVVNRVGSSFKPEDFFLAEHREIAKEIEELRSSGKDVNILTVLSNLERKKSNVTKDFLDGLTDYMVDPTAAVTFATQVSEAAGMRYYSTQSENLSRDITQGLTLPGVVSKLNEITSSLVQKSFGPTEKFGESLQESWLNTLMVKRGEYSFCGISEIDDKIYDFNPGEIIVIAARPGSGKALPNSFPVLTTKGWKKNGDLKTGDLVYSRKGKKSKILGVYPQGERDIYKVTFSDDSYTLCDLEHLWYTEAKETGVKTTKEIMESIIIPGETWYNHSIPVCEPIDHEHKKFNVDPYVYGVSLFKNNTKGYKLRGVRYKMNQKKIHRKYLLGSIHQRAEVLQGIFDAGGADIRDGYITLTMCSKQLATGVVSLVNSLGGLATKTLVDGYYEVAIILNDLTKSGNTLKRYITKVEFSHIEEATCIEVDNPEHLYIVKDYVVTHNTAFMLQSAKQQISQGRTVGFITMEMDEGKLMTRLISAHSKIPSDQITALGTEVFENSKVVESLAFFTQNENLVIDKGSPYDIDTVEKVIRKMKYVHHAEVVYVDYIQLIEASKFEKGGNRNQELTTISRRLKNLATDLGICIVEAAQLNRESTKRGASGPVLSDLRDSGAIEQDASVVIFLYPSFSDLFSEDQQDDYMKRSEVNIKFEIAKQRNGPLWVFDVVFNKPIGTFYEKNLASKFSDFADGGHI